jgi:NTE family protein
MKRRIFIVLFICFEISANFAIERPKIGLVLGGGGAKGFAHIGALKLIDSLNIPIDYIVGTSIGGIAGGLYSIGYTGKDLEQLAHETDWEEIFSDTPERELLPYFVRRESGRYQLTFGLKGVKPTPPRGLINGQKISLLLSSLTFPYENVEDFDHLPIPFRPVAVDLVTGNEVILRSGSLAKALRATMAIPTVFSPVDWGDSLLVDGGLLNNLPVDVIKEMGADIVIAVDLSSPLKSRQELGSAIEILEQTISIYDREKWTRNVRQADIFLHPDLALFTAADFADDKIDQILLAGEREAHAHLDEFLQLIQAFDLKKIEHDGDTVQLALHGISKIRIVGNHSLTAEEIKARLGIEEQNPFNAVRFKTQIEGLKETYYFKKID